MIFSLKIGVAAKNMKWKRTDMLKIGLSIFLVIAIPALSFSDTLYLKTGRKIISDTVWEEKDHYMYLAYGATVGISKEEVEKVVYSGEEKAFFQFDIWPFGGTLEKVIHIAQDNDIPLNKSGLISMDKHFHPKVWKSMDSDHFYYNTNLLGHFAKVELYFTPVSKNLHTVTINWSNQNKNDSKLAAEIISMVSQKYGEPGRKHKELFSSVLEWIFENENQIKMQIRSNNILLNYLHKELRQRDEEEREAIKVQTINEGSKKDKGKF
jgi:hypothetical protein